MAREKKPGEKTELSTALIIPTEWPANGLPGRAGHYADIRRVWRCGFLECETQPRTDMKTTKLFALAAALAAFHP
jgi:hypothetical protein